MTVRISAATSDAERPRPEDAAAINDKVLRGARKAHDLAIEARFQPAPSSRRQVDLTRLKAPFSAGEFQANLLGEVP